MSAGTVAQPTRARQLLSFGGDRTRRRLQERAGRLLTMAIERDKATRALIDHLYAEKGPGDMALAEALTKEVRGLYALARNATERVNRYNRDHPIASY